jgi:hypothetical protein
LALPFAGVGLPAEAVGVSPQVSGIDGGIATKGYFQCYGLGNKLMETFIENVFTQVVAEVGEGELICCFHKRPPVLFGEFYHVAGDEGRKREAGKPKFEAKNKAFEN